jgi:hypothetical protein
MPLASSTRLIAAALIVGAIGAPSAHAQVAPPILRAAGPSELRVIKQAEAQAARRLAYTLPQTAQYSNAEMNAYASALHPVAVSTPDSNGFDYGAAGVGAGLTAGIVLLITAGTLTIRRRSQLRHP